MLNVLLFGSISLLPAALLRFVFFRRNLTKWSAYLWTALIVILYQFIIVLFHGRASGYGISITLLSYFILRYGHDEYKPNNSSVNQPHQQGDRIV